MKLICGDMKLGFVLGEFLGVILEDFLPWVFLIVCYCLSKVNYIDSVCFAENNLIPEK